jgi:N2227-like protein
MDVRMTAPAGPLLWHFENNTTNDPSIELDLEEVKKLVRDIGFELSVSLLIPHVHETLKRFVVCRKKDR